MEPEAGDVEERLVEREPLDERRELAEHREDLLRDPPVLGMVRRDHDQAGTGPPGGPHRHGGADAERTGLVGGGGDDPPRTAAADDHRPGPERRVAKTLDLDEEGVHVDVEDRLAEPHAVTVPGSRPPEPTATTVSVTMAGDVHLLRHGEVENPDHVVYAGLPGFHLTDRGRRQAREAARFLGGRPIVAVWSSPLERALETAAVVAARFGLPVLVDDDLTEWRLADRWAGIVWEDLPAVLPGELEAYLSTPEDLPFSPESLGELADRIREVLLRIRARHREGDVVVVSHQDPIQVARLVATGRPVTELWTDNPAHAEVITLRPGTPWRELSRWAPPDQGDDPTRSREGRVPEPGEQLSIGGEGELG